MGAKRLLLVAVIVTFAALGPFAPALQGMAFSAPANTEKQIIVATGSPFELGLVDALGSAFKAKTGTDVRCIKTPTGPGLELGRNGLAHITMGHDPLATEQFAKDGYATKRIAFMHNNTVIVGPASDPAGIAGLTGQEGIREAHRRIFEAGAKYLSRGDKGGMNLLELRTWEELGLDPSDKDWYRISRKFMLDSLREADENGEYHMLDSSTWAMYQSQMKQMQFLIDGPSNNYEMCLVNSKKNPNLAYNQDLAEQFYDFVAGEEGQHIIATFGTEKYGMPLYYADVIK